MRAAWNRPAPSGCGARRALILYAESSAVLAWLLGEASRGRVRDAIAEAELVIASDLTLLECERSLIRGVATGVLTEPAARERHAALSRMGARWRLMPISREVIDRARRPFPTEPLRSLDAIHLASAMLAADGEPQLAVLSLDRRIRASAVALGLLTLPD